MQFTLGRKKRPDEKFRIGVDFTPDIDSADSASSTFTITAINKKGVDISGTFLSNPQRSGNIISANILAGGDGDLNKVFFKLTTTGGSIFEHSVVVQVGIDT